MVIGWMQASVPPETTTSARPERIISRPTETASAPEAHALTGVWMPAFAPMSRPTQAAAPLGMSIGTDIGDTRDQPRVLRTSFCSSSDTMPPMPLATTTPSRSGSSSGEPASFQASRPAISASCWLRSRRRVSTRSMTSLGSTATWPAKRTGSSEYCSPSSIRTPERPVSSPSHVEVTSPPTGVVAPRPVMTTRRGVLLMGRAPCVIEDGVGGRRPTSGRRRTRT